MPSYKPISAILLSALLLLWVYFFWFPAQVNQQTELAFIRYPVNNNTLHRADLAGEALSEGLLDYLRKHRAVATSTSDTLTEEALIESFQKFEKEYSLKDESEGEVLAPFDAADTQLLRGDNGDFEVPPGLKNIVNFWVNIFGKWDKNFVIFHHPENVGIIYSVLDFSELGTQQDTDVEGVFTGIRGQVVDTERRRIKKMLSNIAGVLRQSHVDLSVLNEDERRIANLLIQEQEGLNLATLDSDSAINTRSGWSHRFRRAIQLSGQYMPEMRRIFSQYGLPDALTCIPFVESAFSEKAYSSAGAAGIWQFIAATGKRYLRIDESVDERYDPILATHAAARHLAAEYKMLGSWPLTINAYNTGPGRILDAMKTLSTRDITTIIKRYRGSGYGYDSRNYFPEVLAAIEVYNNRFKYFGDIEALPRQEYAYIRMPLSTNIKEVLREAGVEMDVVRKMNLAIDPSVLNGERHMPKGYLLKVLPEHKEDILLALHERSLDQKQAAFHVTERGETINQIANKYVTTSAVLERLNNLSPNQNLKTGQVLRLPEAVEDNEVSFDENSLDDMEELEGHAADHYEDNADRETVP